MSRVFEDIELEWGGEKYTIPSNRVFGVLARIEQFLTLDEIYAMTRGQNLKFVAIAQAYATALRYAGAQVTDEEVYKGMFEQSQETGEDKKSIMMSAVFGLMNMLVPESSKQKAAKEGNGNRQARRAEASLSKKHSKRQSAGA